MFGSRYWALGLIGGVALLGMTACESLTQEQLQGILQNVDSVSGDVTVTMKDGSTMKVNLQDIDVEALRQAAGSASLEPGSQVTVEMDDDKKVTKLKTHVAEAEGTVKSVDETAKTITIDREKGDDVTLKVTDDTKLEAGEDRDEATLSSFQVGQEVEAKFDVQTNTALKIETQDDEDGERHGGRGNNGNRGPGNAQGPWEVRGSITAIDANAKTITVLSQNGVEDTYKVMPSTRLDPEEGAGTFAELQAGMDVKIKFDRTSQELIRLQIDDD